MDHRFGLDVDYSFACLRIVDLSIADSELGEPAKGCLEDFNEAGAHVPDDTDVVQLLDAEVELAEQLSLLDGHSRFLKTTDGLRHHQIRVDVALQQVSQELEGLLVGFIISQIDLIFLKVNLQHLPAVRHSE